MSDHVQHLIWDNAAKEWACPACGAIQQRETSSLGVTGKIVHQRNCAELMPADIMLPAQVRADAQVIRAARRQLMELARLVSGSVVTAGYQAVLALDKADAAARRLEDAAGPAYDPERREEPQ